MMLTLETRREELPIGDVVVYVNSPTTKYIEFRKNI